MKAWVLVCMLAVPSVAHAELFTFVDAEGVVHFTNLPNDPRYKPYQVEKTHNSFQWKDDLGTLRTVHRVDITTYDALIREAARYYSLPPSLVKAVVAVESSFEPKAVSPAGALGLMQLIPRTAEEMQVQDTFDARDNIYGGTRYLRVLANHFAGDLRKTIAAYNAGPTAVTRAGDVPNFEETRRYVQRVLTLYRHYLAHWESP